MNCPKCTDHALQESLGPKGVAVDLCRKCCGIWLDKGESCSYWFDEGEIVKLNKVLGTHIDPHNPQRVLAPRGSHPPMRQRT